jgi:hypothetical protein
MGGSWARGCRAQGTWSEESQDFQGLGACESLIAVTEIRGGVIYASLAYI